MYLYLFMLCVMVALYGCEAAEVQSTKPNIVIYYMLAGAITTNRSDLKVIIEISDFILSLHYRGRRFLS